MSARKIKRKTAFAVIVVIGVALIIGRVYLPYWLKDYVNAEINRLDNYTGGVEDIEVSLWRGAYQIKSLHIDKIGGGLDEPFIAAETVDLSVNWPALLSGAVVAEIDIYAINFNFSTSQTGQGEGNGWATLVNALSPFDINRFDVHSGRLSYLDKGAEPEIDLFIKDVDAQITNLRQIEGKDVKLPSNLTVRGTSIGGGAFAVDGKMNILKDVPDFDIALSLEDADLTAFNAFLNRAISVDVNDGKLGIYGELAAADGDVVGYVKPIATEIDLVSLEQDNNLFNLIWEGLASLFITLFENQETDQFAMRIPLEGQLNDPDGDMWSGFWSIFANAFGNAFTRDEDGTINFNDALVESSDTDAETGQNGNENENENDAENPDTGNETENNDTGTNKEL